MPCFQNSIFLKIHVRSMKASGSQTKPTATECALSKLCSQCPENERIVTMRYHHADGSRYEGNWAKSSVVRHIAAIYGIICFVERADQSRSERLVREAWLLHFATISTTSG